MAGFWKTDLHLSVPFLQAGCQIDLLIRAASHKRRSGISSPVPVFQDLRHKLFAVSVAVMNFRINGIGQSKIETAAFQNDFIKMKNS